MKHARKTRSYCGIVCGTILALAGLHMFALKVGWIPEDLFRFVPFFPLALVFFGILIIYSSIFKKTKNGGTDHQTGGCC